MKLISLILLILVFIPNTVEALDDQGGWISSGGESFLDAKNPWFLKGAGAKFCIVADSSSMDQSLKVLEESVSFALNYWQKEFLKESGPILGHNRKSFRLGENTFIKAKPSECDDSVDLKFIFGSKSLSKKQSEYLKQDKRSYIGVTVRTGYDTKKLKGRGFVFISSNRDIDAFGNSSDRINSPWKEAKLIKLALIHELGHVFGIPHMGSSIMSEVFMDLITSKYYYKDFIRQKIESFIGVEKEVKRCGFITPDMTNFFRLGFTNSCLIGKWKDPKTFEIFSQAHNQTPVHVATLVSLSVDEFGIESRPIGFLRVTPEQTVFKPSEINNRSLVMGPLLERYKMKGRVIVQKTFETFPVQLSVSPESITANSVSNGRFVTIFSYDSPYSYILGQTLDIQL
jgi:hypothetical protein